jgi:hypothetical protein
MPRRCPGVSASDAELAAVRACSFSVSAWAARRRPRPRDHRLRQGPGLGLDQARVGGRRERAAGRRHRVRRAAAGAVHGKHRGCAVWQEHAGSSAHAQCVFSSVVTSLQLGHVARFRTEHCWHADCCLHPGSTRCADTPGSSAVSSRVGARASRATTEHSRRLPCRHERHGAGGHRG